MSTPTIRRGVGLALGALALVATAACSDSSGAGLSDGNADEAAAAKTAVEKWTKPMSGVTVSEPLKAKPTPGKTMVSLTCEAPLCAVISAGVEQAAEAAGWEYSRARVRRHRPYHQVRGRSPRPVRAWDSTRSPTRTVKGPAESGPAGGRCGTGRGAWRR